MYIEFEEKIQTIKLVSKSDFRTIVSEYNYNASASFAVRQF